MLWQGGKLLGLRKVSSSQAALGGILFNSLEENRWPLRHCLHEKGDGGACPVHVLAPGISRLMTGMGKHFEASPVLQNRAGEKLTWAQAECCLSVLVTLLQFGVQVLLPGFAPRWGGVGQARAGDCFWHSGATDRCGSWWAHSFQRLFAAWQLQVQKTKLSWSRCWSY